MDEFGDYNSYFSTSSFGSVAPPGALTGSSPLTTGTTNYNVGDGFFGSTGSSVGAVVNSSANPITSNSGPIDASGGNGSFPLPLQNIVTQGLNDNQISQNEFGLGSLTDLLRVGSQGQVAAASAPSAPSAQSSTTGIPSIVWIGAAVVIVLLLVK